MWCTVVLEKTKTQKYIWLQCGYACLMARIFRSQETGNESSREGFFYLWGLSSHACWSQTISHVSQESGPIYDAKQTFVIYIIISDDHTTEESLAEAWTVCLGCFFRLVDLLRLDNWTWLAGPGPARSWHQHRSGLNNINLRDEQ